MGDERIEYSLAVLASVIANVAIGALGKKGAKLTSPMDFFPKWDPEELEILPEEPKKQSVDEMKAILQGIASVMNKRYGKKATRKRR